MISKIISNILLGVYIATSIPTLEALDETRTYRSILKIRTYEYNSTNGTYTATHIGSAVAIGSGRLLTNAHVIFDKDGEKPNGYYEICRTIDFRKKPVCFTSGELLAYDESIDLAVISYREPSDLPSLPLFQESLINIGAPIVIYGYPSIGGDNISRSEGNVAGYQEPYYKIDGAVDHGNSGGAAVNRYGELLGIPSRVASDNAVFGYMIPITTIREFLAKKSKEYTSISLPVPQAFKDYIKSSQLGERSNDLLNDTNIKTVSMKKYGLKYNGKLETVSTFLYAFAANNLNESSVVYSCPRVGGDRMLSDIDARDVEDDMKKYRETITPIGDAGRYTVKSYTSLVSTDASDFVKVFDTRTSCFSAIYGVNLVKHKALIDKAITFLTTGITQKKLYAPISSVFDTQIFHIEKFPTGISLIESPTTGGNNQWMMGYFSQASNTGETLAYISQKKRETLNNYFLGGNGYYDYAPSDENLKSSDYSQATYQKLYEKEYEDDYYENVKFAWYTTKNQKKILIGTYDYDGGDDGKYTKIIVSYPYMITVNGKTEYYDLSYSNKYLSKNILAIEKTKEFFTTFEPVGTAPF